MNLSGLLARGAKSVLAFLDAATRPANAITQPAQRQQARALAWVTLCLLPMISLSVFVTLPIAISDLPNHDMLRQPMFLVGLWMIAATLAAYVLARSRFYRVGSLGFVSLLTSAIYLSALLGRIDVAGRIELLSWLVVGLVIGSFFLSAPATAMLGALEIVAILIFPIFHPDNSYSTLVGVLSFMIVMSVAIVVIKHQRDLLERERQAELAQRVADLTAEFETASRRLHDLSKERNRFINNISHELRTPLTSIKMNHELLRQDPARGAEFLDRLDRETQRLQQIVEQLLQASRIDRSQYTLHRLSLDLNELVQHLVEDRQPMAHDRGLSLSARVMPGLAPVRADHGQIGQVLSILLTNAINYTPRKGKIVISTSAHRIEGVDYVGFSVSDSGPGVTAQEKDRLFERFFRGQAGQESRIAGTGLGLAIARTMVEAHNGLIEVKSDGVPGRGAEFCVWLPAAPGLTNPLIDTAPKS